MSADEKIPFLTLCHGKIPRDLVWDGTEDGAPVAAPTPADATGWWVAGVDWDDVDDGMPYILDGETPATIHDARRHFDPFVGKVAARLLGVEHDVVVIDWVPMSGLTAGQRRKPLLGHKRHTLTIATDNGRSRTWWGLSSGAVDTVLDKVQEFDADRIVDEGPPYPKPRATVVTLDMPVDEDGDTAPVGGVIERQQVTIRIAAITEIVHDVRSARLSSDEMSAVLTKHDPARSRG